MDQPEDLLRTAVEPDGDWTLVRVSGELDYTTAGRFRECVDRLLEPDPVRIALDLSALTFCDSVGIACFVSAWRRARQADGDLVLLRPAGHVQRMLRITNLDRSIAILDTPPGTEPSGGETDLTPAP